MAATPLFLLLTHPPKHQIPLSFPFPFPLPSLSTSHRPPQFTRRCQFLRSPSPSPSPSPSRSLSDDGESLGEVDELTIPPHWFTPSMASQEAEWLRVTLHKWLDDEYCPEPTNVDISKVAAESYYRSLLQKTTDLGEILLKMVRDLEFISYQESFHGAFSSANAAISLIADRIEKELF